MKNKYSIGLLFLLIIGCTSTQNVNFIAKKDPVCDVSVVGYSEVSYEEAKNVAFENAIQSCNKTFVDTLTRSYESNKNFNSSVSHSSEISSKTNIRSRGNIESHKVISQHENNGFHVAIEAQVSNNDFFTNFRKTLGKNARLPDEFFINNLAYRYKKDRETEELFLKDYLSFLNSLLINKSILNYEVINGQISPLNNTDDTFEQNFTIKAKVSKNLQAAFERLVEILENISIGANEIGQYEEGDYEYYKFHLCISDQPCFLKNDTFLQSLVVNSFATEFELSCPSDADCKLQTFYLRNKSSLKMLTIFDDLIRSELEGLSLNPFKSCNFDALVLPEDGYDKPTFSYNYDMRTVKSSVKNNFILPMCSELNCPNKARLPILYTPIYPYKGFKNGDNLLLQIPISGMTLSELLFTVEITGKDFQAKKTKDVEVIRLGDITNDILKDIRKSIHSRKFKSDYETVKSQIERLSQSSNYSRNGC